MAVGYHRCLWWRFSLIQQREGRNSEPSYRVFSVGLCLLNAGRPRDDVGAGCAMSGELRQCVSISTVERFKDGE